MLELTWTVRRTLEWTQGYLERHNDPQPRLSAQWLVSHATNLSRIELYMDIDRPLSKPELAVLHESVERRGAHEPLQYICGNAPFRYLNFHVEPGVLIPRPETEMLVDQVLEYLKGKTTEADELKSFIGVDIGTGSGNIALSIAHEMPSVKMYALDICNDAISVAMQNAQTHNLADRVDFIESDVLSGLPESLEGKIDFIVSNPPYIPTGICNSLASEVKDYEPLMALDGGEDGLDVYRKILEQSCRFLRPDGLLACELHETTLQSAKEIALKTGYSAIKIMCDLNNKDRVILMKK